eukprot:CAMPEP_0114233408 /NCGR_PEP_ID=MMETSP0058-20121206/5150_1 /TAXON_ID=36894 /ORGANISM="Pyramimonas parkeae, CCMP726" /LENGTH=366 /DNA_ID=CAMNT_0001344999 /DNA_START=289 /DNA_END=1389 /DNA_ORIENTATION=+
MSAHRMNMAVCPLRLRDPAISASSNVGMPVGVPSSRLTGRGVATAVLSQCSFSSNLTVFSRIRSSHNGLGANAGCSAVASALKTSLANDKSTIITAGLGDPDSTSSAGLRRRALARLQGLLPQQWGTPDSAGSGAGGASAGAPKDTGITRSGLYGQEPKDDPYSLEQYNGRKGGAGLAQRTMITIRFQVHYQTYLGQELLIGGSHPSLGSWDSDRAIPMVWTPGDIWMVEVELPAGAVCFYKYLLAEGNRLEWQRGANHVLALPTEEHHVPDRVYEATDLWSGEPTASSSAWQELLVRRIEEADELRRMAESDSSKSRAMAEAALTELIQAREEASAAWDLLKERGWLPAPEPGELPPGGGSSGGW